MVICRRQIFLKASTVRSASFVGPFVGVGLISSPAAWPKADYGFAGLSSGLNFIYVKYYETELAKGRLSNLQPNIQFENKV